MRPADPTSTTLSAICATTRPCCNRWRAADVSTSAFREHGRQLAARRMEASARDRMRRSRESGCQQREEQSACVERQSRSCAERLRTSSQTAAPGRTRTPRRPPTRMAAISRMSAITAPDDVPAAIRRVPAGSRSSRARDLGVGPGAGPRCWRPQSPAATPPRRTRAITCGGNCRCGVSFRSAIDADHPCPTLDTARPVPAGRARRSAEACANA